MREAPTLPPAKLVRQNDTHRLIPSKSNRDGESVLSRIAGSPEHLSDLFELDSATNERLWAENNRLPGIGGHELVYGVPGYRIINAAFTHAHPLGPRFNGPDRGAWYAGFSLTTSQAEVAFHNPRSTPKSPASTIASPMTTTLPTSPATFTTCAPLRRSLMRSLPIAISLPRRSQKTCSTTNRWALFIRASATAAVLA